jgi:hypothetical protein
MPDLVRFLLLAVVAICLEVLSLVAWYYLRAQRLRERRGDIRTMPRAVVAGYGLTWPYGVAALLAGSAALVAFIHG